MSDNVIRSFQTPPPYLSVMQARTVSCPGAIRDRPWLFLLVVPAVYDYVWCKFGFLAGSF
jgi:hypothetical protein